MRLDEKKVDIVWRYSHTGQFQNGVDPDAVATQSVAVSYWPTSADVVAVDRLVVAGKERNGNTRIEVWTIEPPAIKAVAGGAGGTVYQLTAKALKDVTLLYDAAAAGKDIVRGLIAMRGGSAKVLVHFHDSRDLYTLDWAAEPYTLTLLGSKAMHAALGTEYDLYHGGDHATLGYVYLMGNMEDLSIGLPYMLRDSNRDGIIDSEGTVSPAQWDSLELGRRDLYIEYDGLPWPP